MVLLSRFIIRAGGFGFIVEVSDCFLYAAKAYLGLPLLSAFEPGNTFVFRRRIIRLNVSSVEAVSRLCSRPEVGFSIVEAVMVDMVNDERVRRIYYFGVHLNSVFVLVYGIPDTTSSIKGASTLAGIPFVFA